MGILQDRVAVVTGASRGIGKAIARALAHEGARVALCARNADAIRTAAEEISPGDGRALGFRADVTNAGDVRSLVQAVVARWGQIHILVNNAGINARIPIASDDDAGWRAVLDSTVLGAYYVTREVLRHMPERNSPGRSGPRRTDHQSLLDPGAVRGAGLHGLLHRQARDHRLHPGPGAGGHRPRHHGQRHLSGMGRDRHGRPRHAGNGRGHRSHQGGVSPAGTGRGAHQAHPRPREIADLVVYLASDAASGMIGQAINLDGGQVMS